MTLSLQSHSALYAAFDVYPSAKGAATHIEQAARTLFDAAGGGLLYVLGNPALPRYQREGAVEILRCSHLHDNYLHRALHFRTELETVLQADLHRSVRIAQFRDPWSGSAIIRQTPRHCTKIYEVNGLPSVELSATFPSIPATTLAKIRSLENDCLRAADRIVVPSRIIRDHLLQRNIPLAPVDVIPNGTHVFTTAAPSPLAGRYILYFGAVQAWQGLDVLLKAWALLRDIPDLRLVLCCSVKSRRARSYQKLAENLGIADRLHWEFDLTREALAPWIANAYLTVAPLTECARNLDQGCCPLKILESMGAGVPVVASDLPVVRELIEHRQNGYLVPPGRPAELARTLRILLDYPQVVNHLGNAAQLTINKGFLWSHSNARLGALHRELLLESNQSDDTIRSVHANARRTQALQP